MTKTIINCIGDWKKYFFSETKMVIVSANFDERIIFDYSCAISIKYNKI